MRKYTQIIKVDKPITILPQEEYESLLETIEILGNKDYVKSIEKGLEDLKKGRLYSHSEVFKKKK
ncbi:MAG: hypothetical protein DRI36_06310 [Caldiserica bacterium]|nr:MAG: hypothetical protein DRI36_06310 [Caldisericota bacterium]